MRELKRKRFNLIGINYEQKLYVLAAGKNAVSCLGFEVCTNRTRKLAEELKIYLIDRRPGTAAHYHNYARLLRQASEHAKKTGWRSGSELNPKLVGLEGKRIEAILYGEKTRFIVGKSTGFVPCHLEIKTRRSYGGGALPSDPEQIQILRVL